MCAVVAALQEYEEFRRSLIRYELEMLKAFGFITNVEHPHKLMLNYIQILNLPPAAAMIADEGADNGGATNALQDFVQYAWNVANDR